MLRLLAVALSLAAVISLMPPAAAADPLNVGFAQTEITPPLGYPMAGYFHARGATGVHDPLLAKAMVFRQGQKQAALIVADLINIDPLLTAAVREKITAATGIPSDGIILAATHTHTGPNYKSELMDWHAEQNRTGAENKTGAASKPADQEKSVGGNGADTKAYIPYLVDRLAAAAIDAHRRTSPTNVEVTVGEEKTVAFNRRFVLKDGTVRTWGRLSQPDVVGAAGPTDPKVNVLLFTPQPAEQEPANQQPAKQVKPAAALVNFSLHCDTVEQQFKSEFGADYPGYIERVLQQELGQPIFSLFATAPCGDINHSDPTGATRRVAPEIGEKIAKAAFAAFPDAKPITPSLAVRRGIVQIPLQTYTDEDLTWAADIQARRDSGEKVPTTTAAKASSIRRLYHLRTGRVYRGRDVPEGEPTGTGVESLPAEVQVLRLADNVALVALPGEVFVELGLAIQQASPFEHTIVIELANDAPAYVPTRKAMQQGGYEAANSIYAAGGGEMLVDEAVKLLKELKR